MKKNLLLALIFVVFLGSLGVGDDGSARRYAEFTEHDDLSRMFSLLERKDVQDELKVTPEQATKIKHICHAPDREVSGLLELVANYKKQQSDPALSSSDKEKLRESFNSDIGKYIDAYQRKELPATLSAKQRRRLDELLLQMRGPIAIVDDAAVSSKLQLSGKQRAEMKETVKDYDAELKLLQARYGRQQISGFRYANETSENRQKELEALFIVIRTIEKERDGALLLKFTPQQLALWTTIQGAPFSIAWPPTLVLDSPFSEQN